MRAIHADHAVVKDAGRDDRIVDFVGANGSATVEALAQELGIGPSSVRRVLRRLSDEGRLLRTYGGAAVIDRPRAGARTVTPLKPRRSVPGSGRVVPQGQAVATTSDSTVTEFARLLADQVYESLRSRILRGELRPGERLPLADIANSLGVSLAPVKSAVNRLAADGLVVVSPRIGTVVAPVSEADVREVYQVRLILEPHASQIAAATLSDDELHHLAGLVDRMEASARSGYATVDDYLRELEMDGEFHAGVVRGVRNERLNAFYATIQASVIVARAMFPRVYRDTDELTGGHRRILEALAHRDGESAREATEEHLRSAEHETIRHMAASRSG